MKRANDSLVVRALDAIKDDCIEGGQGAVILVINQSNSTYGLASNVKDEYVVNLLKMLLSELRKKGAS